ncbi:MAG: 50S ribosomal protein L21 [bacterium]
MKLAVIKTGGKQYLVKEGDVLTVEKIESESPSVKFTEVLLIVDGDQVTVGTPLVEKAVVEGEIVKQMKEPKIVVFKMKRRKRSRKSQGHRQQVTQVKINKIAA